MHLPIGFLQVLATRSRRQCHQEHQRGLEQVCPEASKELKALRVRVEEGIDITSDAAVVFLHERLGETQIDVLINNAAMFAKRLRSMVVEHTAEGIAKSITLEHLDFDSIREQFEVNALGALRVTQVLLPLLKAGGKVVMMTSRMGSIADNTSWQFLRLSDV